MQGKNHRRQFSKQAISNEMLQICVASGYLPLINVPFVHTYIRMAYSKKTNDRVGGCKWKDRHISLAIIINDDDLFEVFMRFARFAIALTQFTFA